MNGFGGNQIQARLNENLSQSISNMDTSDDVLHIEDYDAKVDAEFIKEHLTPYLSDLYKDLLMRSN